MAKGPTNRDDLHERVDEMVAATDAFCAEHLTEEFGEMCANLTDEPAMHHEDLLARGQPKSWAAGVLYAIERVIDCAAQASEHQLWLRFRKYERRYERWQSAFT